MKFAVDEATAAVEAACEAITLLEKETISEKKREEVANTSTGCATLSGALKI